MSVDYHIYVGPVVRCVLTKATRRMDPFSDLDDSAFMDIPDRDSEPDRIYWLNFDPPKTARPFHIDDCSKYALPISPGDVSDEIAWLGRTYQKDIDRMRERYGADSVTIEWGAYRWTS